MAFAGRFMWFLIRSAFWLGLVFSWIDWPGGAPTPPDAAAIADSAATGAASLCAQHPGACLRVARQAARAAPAIAAAGDPVRNRQAPRS